MDNHKEIDYLIVGQGLAGTLAGHFLSKTGASFLILDDEYERASTQVAAGLINPVTGRRFVKSWMIDTLLPFAEATYREIEQLLGLQLFHAHHIVRALFSAGEENDWLGRSALPEYVPYIQEPANVRPFLPYVKPVYAYSEIKNCARVNIALMRQKYKQRFQQSGNWKHDVFDYNQLQVEEQGITYKEWRAKKIIFSEGARVKENPYFNYLPFMCDKGEILLAKIPDVNFDQIYKHKVYLIPYGDDIYWVGASVQWEYADDYPSREAKEELIEKLDKAIDTPYTIIEHQAAIRPTVRDRRPFIGQHPELSTLYLLNGFGTKGTSLAPYWTHHFINYLTRGGRLSEEVDIVRYLRFYQGIK